MPRLRVVILAACLIALATATVIVVTGHGDASCAAQPSRPAGPAAATSAKVVLPAHPKVLIFGDSYTEGWGADPKDAGYAYLVGRDLGWDVTVDGAGGSGYIAVGPQRQGNYLTRLPAAPAKPFDLVVLQGSSNDQGVAAQRLRATVERTVAAVRQRYPAAQLAMMGPVAIYGRVSPERSAVNSVLAKFAQSQHVPYLDPIGEQWFEPGSASTYVNLAVGHPNNAGYARMADRFVRDASALTRTASSRCA